MCIMYSSTILVINFILFALCKSENDLLPNNSLLMVHALFRHGERTTDNFYPTDPYINNTFYPIGKGGLTNRGKLQEFNLGKFLRNRYDHFLGSIYTDDVMKVRSTGFLRTRMSALLVAAGLWPPSSEQIWHDGLPWLGIPVDYKPYEEDDLLNPGACAKRQKILSKQHEDEEVKKVFVTPFKNLMEYLQEKSGKTIKTPADLSELYLTLKTEKDTNYTLPEWTKSVYPEPLYKAASLTYKYFNYNPEVKKINSGYFLKKLVTDFNSKINGSTVPKIYLYCGHESTLGHILDALGFYPYISPYASVILFELHRTSQRGYGVKILYNKGVEDSGTFQNIVLPGCQELCPVEKFEELLSDVLPTSKYYEACKITDS